MRLLEVRLGTDSTIAVPEVLPCHAYALGLMLDYEIGQLVRRPVNRNTSDFEFLNILSDELRILGCQLIESVYGEVSNPEQGKRVIQITRMQTCGDYHFYLVHEDGSISQKYRYFAPVVSSKIELVSGEYSLGTYVVNWTL